MAENLIEAQYDITKKSRLRKFYDSNKILIFTSILLLIISIGSITFYLESKNKKNILLSEDYIQARVYLESNNKAKATTILREIIFANNSTYSVLSFFLILNQNLITDYKELTILFNQKASSMAKFHPKLFPTTALTNCLGLITLPLIVPGHQFSK